VEENIPEERSVVVGGMISFALYKVDTNAARLIRSRNPDQAAK